VSKDPNETQQLEPSDLVEDEGSAQAHRLAAASGDESASGSGEAPDAEAEKSDDDLEDARMSLLEHLQELRQRLRNAGIAFIVALVGSFYFIEDFFQLLANPIKLAMVELGLKPSIYYSGVGTGFWVYFKLSIIVAILVASPLIFWEIWKFVAPGLYKKEKKLALTITAATAFCFIGGSLFGYKMLSKTTCIYLLGIGHRAEAAEVMEKKKAELLPKRLAEAETAAKAEAAKAGKPTETVTADRLKVEQAVERELQATLPMDVMPWLMMDQVMDFQVMMLLGCGAAFELPVVLSVLGWIALVSARGLWKFNKYALILCAVTGGILTPSPDAISQLMLAGPLYALYNVSIVIVWLIERGRKKREAELEKEYGAQG
jgi:sec-independent protein translocase protein TatC